MQSFISRFHQTNFSFQLLSTTFSVWSIFILLICYLQLYCVQAQPVITHLSNPTENPNHSSKNDQDAAYVAILRGKNFGDDPQQLHVSINGVPATDVILHNNTAFSFRIPNHMVDNPKLLQSSYLQITVGTVRQTSIPLFILKDAISKVHMPTFRRQIEERNNPNVKQFHDDSQNQFSSQLDENDNQDFNSSSQRENPVQSEIDKTVSEAEYLLKSSKRDSITNAIKLLDEAIEKNSPRAMTVMATLLLGAHLPGLKRDMTKAVHYLQLASDQGYADAQALLGFLYASGIAGTALRKDVGAAILMWTFAAEGGSIYAQMALGYRYFTGTDVPEDCQKASQYYKAVADEVFSDTKKTIYGQIGNKKRKDAPLNEHIPEILPPTPNAILTSDRKRLVEGMSRRVRGEANEIVQYYQHMANRGDSSAQVVMGNLHYYGGNDMPQDLVQARYRYEQAARNGRPDAYAHLGFMDLRGGRNESAVRHLKKAAAEDDRLGLHGMGFVTLHGIGVDKNPERAAKYFSQAADKSHPEAMYNLAIMLSKGVGVQQSTQDSYQRFQAAAQSGHLQSNYIVGVMLLEGETPARKDCTQATKYLKYVSEQGAWNKILSLGFRAHESSSYADSLYRYLQAAHAGIEVAQYNAAFMYEHNTLRNQDGHTLQSFDSSHEENGIIGTEREVIVEEALELFQMSASQGYSHSMVRIGDLAFSESVDYSKAALAYEKASKLGNSEAMFNLGWMYARGLGMNSDKHMAKRYFDNAKEVDRDAFIPSSIAVISLQYSESLFGLIDGIWNLSKRISKLLAKFKISKGKELNGKSVVSTPEAIILSILFGALVIVIATRQRRMQNMNEEEQE